MASAPVQVLAREARSLVERLRVWTPERWAAAAPPYGTRGDLVHHLARWFVEQAAETAAPLPRLDSDTALPDQLAVVVDDFLRTGPDERAVRVATAHLLAHRQDLLADEVPAGLLEHLGGIAVRCPG